MMNTRFLVYHSDRGGHPGRITKIPFLLAWMVADGSTLAFVGQERGDVDTTHPLAGGGRNPAYDGQGTGRLARIFARREIHLLQLRTHRVQLQIWADRADWNRPEHIPNIKSDDLTTVPHLSEEVDGNFLTLERTLLDTRNKT